MVYQEEFLAAEVETLMGEVHEPEPEPEPQPEPKPEPETSDAPPEQAADAGPPDEFTVGSLIKK
jgi:hypothetical protein